MVLLYDYNTPSIYITASPYSDAQGQSLALGSWNEAVSRAVLLTSERMVSRPAPESLNITSQVWGTGTKQS